MKPVRIQAFIAKAVEGFDVTVLRGLARFNVPRQDMAFLTPGDSEDAERPTIC